MNEGFNANPSPEEAMAQEAAEEERYAAEMMKLIEQRAAQEAASDGTREAEPEVAELEGLCVEFEQIAPYESLLSVTTPEEAEKSTEREQAKLKLAPMWSLLKKISNLNNIEPEMLEELKAKYNRCSQAVGVIHGGKVDHTRVMISIR